VDGWKPVALSKHDIENAYQVITLDCLLPGKDSIAKPITQWKGLPNISDDYSMTRDEIVKRVQALIDELKKENK